MPKRPDELRELAALAQQEAEFLRKLADLQERRQRLTGGKSSPKLQSVTDAQVVRRGLAIAKGKAKKSKDRLLKAISASKWGSQDTYAPERLRVSPPSLTAYRSGKTACPRRIADMIREDFGIDDDYWPGGIVD